jgi:small subunit ribosomal protein S5
MQNLRQQTCFIAVTAEELWKGALAETGAGARKGRGKRTKKKKRKDLNRGQIIGEGELTLKPSPVLYIPGWP